MAFDSFNQYYCTASAALMLVYLFCSKRNLDVFLIAGGSAVLFSIPLLLGWKLEGPRGWLPATIEPELYFTFGTLFLFILIASIINDNVIYLPRETKPVPNDLRNIIGAGLLLIWLIVFTLLLAKYGKTLLFDTKKRELMDSTGFMLTFYMWISVLTTVWFFYLGGKISKIFASLIVMLGVFLGFRSPLVIAGLSIALLYGRGFGKVSIAKSYPIRFTAVCVLAVVSVSIMKPFYASFKTGGFAKVSNTFSERGVQNISTSGMEFLRTQFIFNEIVIQGYRTDGGHILRGFQSILPLPRSLYTTPSSEFNDLFQKDLFPEQKHGMAYNPFGEFYAGFGMFGTLLLVPFFVFTIFIFAFFIRRGGSWGVFMAIASVICLFYFHRNSVAVTFGFLRNIFWPFLACWLIALCLKSILRGGPRI